MPKFKIPMSWFSYGTLEIEADDICDAVQKAYEGNAFPQVIDEILNVSVNPNYIQQYNPTVDDADMDNVMTIIQDLDA